MKPLFIERTRFKLVWKLILFHSEIILSFIKYTLSKVILNLQNAITFQQVLFLIYFRQFLLDKGNELLQIFKRCSNLQDEVVVPVYSSYLVSINHSSEFRIKESNAFLKLLVAFLLLWSQGVPIIFSNSSFWSLYMIYFINFQVTFKGSLLSWWSLKTSFFTAKDNWFFINFVSIK